VASLDPASSRRVLSQLKTICREDGITTVVSLHQVEFAREFADRVVALARGRVVFDGIPDALTDGTLDAIYEQLPVVPARNTDSIAPSPLLDLALIKD
jgi:phosphonate transport system ATP-binding protein